MNDSLKENSSIEIELGSEVADGTYSNMVLLAHSRTEFVIDFINLLPGVPKAKVKSRIIMAPEHAKRLLLALSENINKYEYYNGNIPLETDTPPMDTKIGQA